MKEHFAQRGPNFFYGVNLYQASINAPASPTYVGNAANGAPYVTVNPADVALAEVQVAPSTYHMYAYYTFTDASNTMYVSQVDCATGIPLAGYPVTISTTNMDIYPRIDALKNFSVNSPSMSTPNADYMAVDNQTSTGKILANSNVASNVDLTCYTGGVGRADKYPTVTFGVSEYTVGFAHEFTPTSHRAFLSRTLDMTTGIPVTSNFYRINSHFIYNFDPEIWTLSSTCNNDGSVTSGGAQPYVQAYWERFLSPSVLGDTWDKITPAVYAGPLWKHASTGLQNTETTSEWQLWPNPGSEQVNVAIPTDARPATYQITNITGREIVKGSIVSGEQSIPIKRFAPGMYILHFYDESNEIKTMKFVKE